MKLPPHWIDKIINKLTARYGAPFLDQYKGIDLQDVKDAWAEELFVFWRHPEVFEWSLEHLPGHLRTINVLGFRDLCRQAPRNPTEEEEEGRLLPPPKPNPAKLRAAREHLASVLASQPADRKSWARSIIERAERGEPVTPTVLAMARGALRHNRITTTKEEA